MHPDNIVKVAQNTDLGYGRGNSLCKHYLPVNPPLAELADRLMSGGLVTDCRKTEQRLRDIIAPLDPSRVQSPLSEESVCMLGHAGELIGQITVGCSEIGRSRLSGENGRRESCDGNEARARDEALKSLRMSASGEQREVRLVQWSRRSGNLVYRGQTTRYGSGLASFRGCGMSVCITQPIDACPLLQ